MLTPEVDGAGARQSMGSALAKLLTKTVPTSGPKDETKTKKRKKTEKQAEEDDDTLSVSSSKSTALSKARRLWLEKEHVVPDATSLTHERVLIKLATRGVVKLFNAVQKQQKFEKSGPKEEISKNKLMDMLKTETAATGKQTITSRSSAGSKSAPQWSVLKDDYVTAQSQNYKDWDKNEDESSEDEMGDLASYGSDEDDE